MPSEGLADLITGCKVGDAQHLTDSWWKPQLGVLFSSPEIMLTNLRGDFDRMIIKQTLFFNCQSKLSGNFCGSLCQCNTISFPTFLAFFSPFYPFKVVGLLAGWWEEQMIALWSGVFWGCSFSFAACSILSRLMMSLCFPNLQTFPVWVVIAKPKGGNMSWACRDVPSQVFSWLAGHPKDLIHDGNLR